MYICVAVLRVNKDKQTPPGTTRPFCPLPFLPWLCRNVAGDHPTWPHRTPPLSASRLLAGAASLRL